MGGCYKVGQDPGNEICTAADKGVCTTCKAGAAYLFQNPASPVAPGNECILCSDTTQRDGVMGVDNCAQCQAPQSAGAATCSTCQDGYFLSDKLCKPCNQNCATCTGAGATNCETCKPGTYLKSDNSCSNTCENNQYADELTMTCKACSEIHADCTACSFDKTTGKPKCTNCGTNKTPRTALDGTSTCVDKTLDGCKGADGALFMKEDKTCALCGDASPDAGVNDKGIAGCSICEKTAGNPPTCSKCLEGYIENTNGGGFACDPCAPGCATCSKKEDPSKCLTCKQGYFLKDSSSGECISCSDTTKGGIEGCAECTNSGTFKCTKCKVNYRPSGEPSTGVTCTKVCEDPTACGGTSGACDAIVIDNTGKELHYCSYCGKDSEFPIDGLCASEAKGNTGCVNNVCTSCTMGYFLYMGGCYSISAQPGKSMCTKAGDGVCTEAAAGYFIPPSPTKDKQSVLSCGNPLGVELAGQKAYVGVDGCSQCTAPTAPSDAGMTPAVCTSCDSDRKPNKDGSGCVTCSVGDCKSCVMDDVCGECSDGYSLEGGKCVSSGANRSGLSTGAIAGISVAVVVVVGGLVGFLCWWFLCRGKA
eukprot:XP_001707733.1 VSP [Giardia lamblia ATCC 50803]